MSKYRYYACIASNAVAVFTSWRKYTAATAYLIKPSCQGFDNFYDAEDWALLQLEERYPRLSAPCSLSPNWVEYFKNLRRPEY